MSSPSGAPLQSLGSIIKAIAEASAKGEAVWRRGEVIFEVTKARFNKAATRVVLLVRHTESEAAGPVMAHLVADLTPCPETGAYRVVIEAAAGLSKARLDQGMQGLARRLSHFYYKDARRQFRQAFPLLRFSASADEAMSFPLDDPRSGYDLEIQPKVSAALDRLLRQRAAMRAA